MTQFAHISGIKRESFIDCHYEKKPFLAKKVISPDIFSLEDLDEVLFSTDWDSTFFKFNDGREISKSKYTEELWEAGHNYMAADVPAIYKLLRGGASLITNRIQAKSAKVRSICNDISQLVAEPVIANGYLTFSDTSPFGAHWDTHDVFAVQLIGRKHWKVFEPTFDAPISGQGSRLHSNHCPATPCIDVILEAGDMLYIPRGWWHDAQGLREKTFHLAIGVHPPRIIDFFEWAAKCILPNIVEARRSTKTALREPLLLQAVANKLAAATTDSAVFSQYLEEFYAKARLPLTFELESFASSSEADWDDKLVRLSTLNNLKCSEGRAYVNGQSYLLSDPEIQIISTLSEQLTLSVRSLLSLVSCAKQELIGALSSLGRKGVIQVVPQSTLMESV